MNNYKCPKCNGTGYLSQYAGIAGGVCFSCQGRGVKTGKPSCQSPKFVITAICKDTGARITVCTVTAKNPEAAVKKAAAQFARGFGYIPESAQVQQ